MLGRSDREQGVLIVEIGQAGRGAQGRFQRYAGQENRVFVGAVDRLGDLGFKAPQDHVLPVAAEHLGDGRAPGAAADYANPVEVCRHAPTLGHVAIPGKSPEAVISGGRRGISIEVDPPENHHQRCEGGKAGTGKECRASADLIPEQASDDAGKEHRDTGRQIEQAER